MLLFPWPKTSHFGTPPVNALGFFLSVCTEEWNKRHPDEKIGPFHLEETCEKKWMTMTDFQKIRFYQMEKTDEKRYDRELEAYNQAKQQKKREKRLMAKLKKKDEKRETKRRDHPVKNEAVGDIGGNDDVSAKVKKIDIKSKQEADDVKVEKPREFHDIAEMFRKKHLKNQEKLSN